MDDEESDNECENSEVVTEDTDDDVNDLESSMDIEEGNNACESSEDSDSEDSEDSVSESEASASDAEDGDCDPLEVVLSRSESKALRKLKRVTTKLTELEHRFDVFHTSRRELMTGEADSSGRKWSFEFDEDEEDTLSDLCDKITVKRERLLTMIEEADVYMLKGLHKIVYHILNNKSVKKLLKEPRFTSVKAYLKHNDSLERLEDFLSEKRYKNVSSTGSALVAE